MANICDNTMHVESSSAENIEYILRFFDDGWNYKVEDYGYDLDITFESKWTFPEEEMEKLYDGLPDPDEILITCLSVELGNLYHALWVCNENGWREV